MIKLLEIENLKSFGGRHSVELAPITLVYGANSAGKSGVLQSLALLKQTLEPRAARVDIDRQPLNLRGDLVDLGSFGATVHRHDRTKPLGLGVHFSAAPPRPRVRPRIPTASDGYMGLSFRFDGETHAVDQQDVVLGIDDDRVRFVPSRPPADPGMPFSSVQGAFRVASARDGAALRSLLHRAYPDAAFRANVDHFLGYDSQPSFLSHGFFPESPWLRSWTQQNGGRMPTTGPSALFGSQIGDIVSGPASALVDVLSQLAYLGPLRAAPTRFQARAGAIYASVGARGEHTPLLLLQQPELIAPVNKWLERLGIHYNLQVAPVEEATVGLEIGDLVVTRLIDTRTHVAVTPQDVGFGISQLLPVIVQSLAGTGRTICIEQPEIHIHPRLQAEVADLFIEAAQQRRNQLIIETHSEHLILRIMRRLKEQGGRSSLNPANVCVLYVDQNDRGVSLPMRLRLDEQGNFLDEWPHGFFSERLAELFPTGSSSSPSTA